MDASAGVHEDVKWQFTPVRRVVMHNRLGAQETAESDFIRDSGR